MYMCVCVFSIFLFLFFFYSFRFVSFHLIYHIILVFTISIASLFEIELE